MKTTLFSALALGSAVLLVSSNSLFASSDKAARAIAIELGLDSDAVSFKDTGYGPNNAGANNGVFDWHDANGNGQLDIDEISEPLIFSLSCTDDWSDAKSVREPKNVREPGTANRNSEGGYVEALRRASEKYPDLAFNIAEIVVESFGDMIDPECAAQFAMAIIEGADLGGSAITTVLRIFIAGFPPGQEVAAARFWEIVTEEHPEDIELPPTSIPQPGPDDVPVPLAPPVATPAPTPTPVQPSPTPVTPFQSL